MTEEQDEDYDYSYLENVYYNTDSKRPSDDFPTTLEKERPPPTVDNSDVFFRDGRRRIDMVLVYDQYNNSDRRREKRHTFQKNLAALGLELELEPRMKSLDGKTTFLKVHAPWEVVSKYAEILKLRVPIKWGEPEDRQNKLSLDWLTKSKLYRMFDYDRSLIPEAPTFFTAAFVQGKEDRFVMNNHDTFFTPAQRSLIVWQILLRTPYDDESEEKVGIMRLLNKEVYRAVYPLHEGSYLEDSPSGVQTDRRLLYLEWGRYRNIFKRQPIWLIKKYFGDKIGLYFAWLGFYNIMLIPPAIFGIIVTIYSFATVFSDDYNVMSAEICSKEDDSVGKLYLCPDCQKYCPFRKLGDTCLLARFAYLFDNDLTVAFSIFMSLWGIAFVELWKRRQAIISWEWDLEDDDTEEETLPEFETKVKTMRINPITKELEPYIPTFEKAGRVFISNGLALIFLMSVLGTTIAVIIVRVYLIKLFYGKLHDSENDQFSKARFLASGIAAFLNLVFIIILNFIYEYVAVWLVKFERPRTQSEFDKSFTFKMFYFQFLNYYSSLLYIGLFKGKFFAHPGEELDRVDEPKNDKCDTVGCWYELSIQLFAIMFGKQIFNNVMEVVIPNAIHWWKKYSYITLRKGSQDEQPQEDVYDQQKNIPRWERDYSLQAWRQSALFDEYLEMVIQFGFVTLYVAAFPLAPALALLNNIFEIRIDANKFIQNVRRPKAQKAKDIGAWMGIMKIIAYLSIVSNGAIVAFTSEFIPKQIHRWNNPDMKGYVASKLTAFNTSHWRGTPADEEWMGPTGENINSIPTGYDVNNFTCYFEAMRGPGPDYELTTGYFIQLMAKFCFLVIFEHVLFAIVLFTSYVVPDIPESVKLQVQREKTLARKVIYGSKFSGEENKPLFTGNMSIPELQRQRTEFNRSRGNLRSPFGLEERDPGDILPESGHI